MEMQGFTKEDIIKQVQKKDIKIINFCHIPEDCRLKTLSFSVRNKERLLEILEFGERVDGSSLFSYIDPSKSDIYIMPKPETAFLNPFSLIPTLNILCRYLDENGKPLDIASENILLRAEEKMLSSTGIILKALAELEFYMIYKREEGFTEVSERNYHESTPFSKFEKVRNESLVMLDNLGMNTKYGHAEVGRFHSKTGYLMEQHEIEFLPQNLSKMAETVTMAKWVIRNICAEQGIHVSFSAKPALEHAGSGMHIHLCGYKKSKSVITDSKGNLTVEAKQMIGGILKFAPSLAAFGNTTPVSYLRFISRRESPMYICWGIRNRLALIRIPLLWGFKKNIKRTGGCVPTFEFRAPDPGASIYLLLAGIAVAAEYGLKNPKKALELAEDLDTEKWTGKKKKKTLPMSCAESAKNLKRDRHYYETDGVFPDRVIDGIISKLESYKDKNLRKEKANKQEKIEQLLSNYLYCS